ncbi:MAG: hypothetical protein WB869_11455 [Candidatus Acidiferrales bacterium]
MGGGHRRASETLMFAEVLFNTFVLRKWKENPAITKREIGFSHNWLEDKPENNLPLSQTEVEKMKKFLRQHAPSSYWKMFPE